MFKIFFLGARFNISIFQDTAENYRNPLIYSEYFLPLWASKRIYLYRAFLILHPEDTS